MNSRFRLLAPFSLLPFVVSGTAATPPDSGPVIVIQNATILTVTQGTIEHGSILIKDGKIVPLNGHGVEEEMLAFAQPAPA